MKIDEIVNLSTAREKQLAQTNLMAERQINLQQDGAQLDVPFMPVSPVLLIPISFMMVWTIFVFMSSDIWIFARYGLLKIKYLHQIPCRNCRFFKNNPYLQCAVNPATALTPQAIHCSDFR
ncbi:MAG TPA: hypothetical protein DCE56_06045, partial [Cyanobacteria bacterium UBA8553]|nr:hypothetical protein [Cyanobacteria bacterium UBA8553]